MTQTQQTTTLRKFTHHELEDLVLNGDIPRNLTKDQREFFIELDDLIGQIRVTEADDEHLAEVTEELETANNALVAIKKILEDGIG